jgi:hypothetical protein
MEKEEQKYYRKKKEKTKFNVAYAAEILLYLQLMLEAGQVCALVLDPVAGTATHQNA